jgi:signal transduction histidine kinase
VLYPSIPKRSFCFPEYTEKIRTVENPPVINRQGLIGIRIKSYIYQQVVMMSNSPGSRSRAIAPASHHQCDGSLGLSELYPFFQEQLLHTVEYLAATQVWLGVYGTLNPLDTVNQPTSAPSTYQSGYAPRILHYCGKTDSYAWLTAQDNQHIYQYFNQTFPFMRGIELTDYGLNGGDRNRETWNHDVGKHTYLCAYGLNPTQFLLIQTKEPLSSLQTHCFEQYARLIQQHVKSAHQHQHHTHKIQLLEQTIHRVEHQLRNPLELICLYANVLNQQLAVDPFGEQLQQISKAAHTIRHHLSRIKGYSQSSRLQSEPCQLNRLMTEVVESLHPLATEKAIQIECTGPAVEITVDPWQFKEALTNLVSNALYFSPPGEPISCRWRVFSRETVIEICDKGSGFSPQDLKKAFTPFYSRRPGGTGLGLTLARKIVLDHQGSLWADNLPTGGACLSIVLPRNVQTVQNGV